MKHLKYLPHALGFFSEPFELFLAFASVLSGILFLTGNTKPGALEQQLPGWQLALWVAGFTAGGLIIIVSRAMIARAKNMRSLEIGARVEAVGMTIFGGAAGMYAVAIFALGKAGFFAGLIIGAWSASAFVRLYIINKQWAPVRRDRRDPRNGDEVT